MKIIGLLLLSILSADSALAIYGRCGTIVLMERRYREQMWKSLESSEEKAEKREKKGKVSRVDTDSSIPARSKYFSEQSKILAKEEVERKSKKKEKKKREESAKEKSKVKAEVNSELAEFVEELGAEWADGNITTGTTRLGVKILEGIDVNVASDAEIGDFAETEFRAKFKEMFEEDLPGKVKVKIRKVSSSQIRKIGIMLARSNADLSGEPSEEFEPQVKMLLEKMGNKKDLVIVKAHAEVLNEGEIKNDYRDVDRTLIINKRTAETAVIFTIEASPM